MDLLLLLRTLGGLGIVLGLLAGALWVVRRYDIKLPGRIGGGAIRRLDLVERLAIDNKRSVALIRRDGCEHLVLLDPAGAVVIETGIGLARAPGGAGCSERPVQHETRASVHKDADLLERSRPAGGDAGAADDMVPFVQALSRIQEKARRMRETVAASSGHDQFEDRPHA